MAKRCPSRRRARRPLPERRRSWRGGSSWSDTRRRSTGSHYHRTYDRAEAEELPGLLPEDLGEPRPLRADRGLPSRLDPPSRGSSPSTTAATEREKDSTSSATTPSSLSCPAPTTRRPTPSAASGSVSSSTPSPSSPTSSPRSSRCATSTASTTARSPTSSASRTGTVKSRLNRPGSSWRGSSRADRRCPRHAARSSAPSHPARRRRVTALPFLPPRRDGPPRRGRPRAPEVASHASFCESCGPPPRRLRGERPAPRLATVPRPSADAAPPRWPASREPSRRASRARRCSRSSPPAPSPRPSPPPPSSGASSRSPPGIPGTYTLPPRRAASAAGEATGGSWSRSPTPPASPSWPYSASIPCFRRRERGQRPDRRRRAGHRRGEGRGRRRSSTRCSRATGRGP